jgi:hypothetical protein
MDVSNNTYIKQKEIAEKFSFHLFPKARHLVSQIIRKEWIVRCRRKLRLQQITIEKIVAQFYLAATVHKGVFFF